MGAATNRISAGPAGAMGHGDVGDDGNLEALPDFELVIPRKRGPQHKRRSVEQVYIEARRPELVCMAWVPELRTVMGTGGR